MCQEAGGRAQRRVLSDLDLSEGGGGLGAHRGGGVDKPRRAAPEDQQGTPSHCAIPSPPPEITAGGRAGSEEAACGRPASRRVPDAGLEGPRRGQHRSGRRPWYTRVPALSSGWGKRPLRQGDERGDCARVRTVRHRGAGLGDEGSVSAGRCGPPPRGAGPGRGWRRGWGSLQERRSQVGGFGEGRAGAERKGVFKDLAGKGKRTLIPFQAQPDSTRGALRARLWNLRGHRSKPRPCQALCGDRTACRGTAAPAPSSSGIPWPQGASPKANPPPVHSVESCLVASLERFHDRDPNPHGRRKQGPPPRTHRRRTRVPQPGSSRPALGLAELGDLGSCPEVGWGTAVGAQGPRAGERAMFWRLPQRLELPAPNTLTGTVPSKARTVPPGFGTSSLGLLDAWRYKRRWPVELTGATGSEKGHPCALDSGCLSRSLSPSDWLN